MKRTDGLRVFSYLGIRTKEAARDDASGAQDTPVENLFVKARC